MDLNEQPRAGGDGAAPAGRGYLLALSSVLVLGATLRLVGLDAGPWYDEIETLVRYVRQPIGHVLTTYDSQNQHLFYSVLAKLSVALFGDHTWSLRLPAAAFGVASLWAVAGLGTEVSSRREGLVAALLLAVSYHHVWFSQNARGYTALLFFTVLATRQLLAMLQGPGGRRVVAGYAVAMGLALYTHLTAVFVLAAHGLLLALESWRQGRSGATPWLRPAVVSLALAVGLAALLYAPVIPSLWATAAAPTMAGTEVVWRSPLWFVREAFAGLVRGLPGGWVALLAGATVSAVGVVGLGRRSPAVAAAMLLPVAVTAAALLATAHNLWPRFFFFAAGFAVLIVVRGTFAIARTVWPLRAEAVATAGLVLAAVGSATTVPRAWQPKQDFAGARAWLTQQAGPDDAVVVVDMTRLPYRDYLRTDWPAVHGEAELTAIQAAHRRTWVAYTFPARLSAVEPGIWSRLQRDYTEANVFPGTVGGGAVVIMVSPEPPTSTKGTL